MDIVTLSWEETIPIRHAVLWPEKAPVFCHVAGDEEGCHYGVMVDHQLVSVASIYFEKGEYLEGESVRLRKFATLPDFQRQGIGRALLTHILHEVRERQVRYFWFDARESALSFYRQFGFETEGERFDKGDIPYFKMSRSFSASKR